MLCHLKSGLKEDFRRIVECLEKNSKLSPMTLESSLMQPMPKNLHFLTPSTQILVEILTGKHMPIVFKLLMRLPKTMEKLPTEILELSVT